MVEHYLDTVGVTGSNPVSRTTLKPLKQSGLHSRKAWFLAFFKLPKKSHFLPFLTVFWVLVAVSGGGFPLPAPQFSGRRNNIHPFKPARNGAEA